MARSTSSKQILRLPVQTLSLSSIKELDKLCKIFLQFDLKGTVRGQAIFNLVAYPAYKSRKDGQLLIGKKIPLTIQKPVKFQELRLPLTLGNLEIVFEELRKKGANEKTKLVFTPRLYRANPHAEYLVDESSGQFSLLAKPSPPAPPSY